jgi:hypothetical protein
MKCALLITQILVSWGLVMGQETRYFKGIHEVGGYYFEGYNETKDPSSEAVCFKFCYAGSRLTKVETQQNGVTKDLFFSQPAVILYEYAKDSTIITFKDALNAACRFENVDRCVVVTNSKRTESRARFYCEGKQVADAAGRFEMVYRLKGNEISEWSNFDQSNHLRHIERQGYASCRYTYWESHQMKDEMFLDEADKPALVKGIDWSDVECGSPSPDHFYYYHRIRYCYDERNVLTRTEYYDERSQLVFANSSL